MVWRLEVSRNNGVSYGQHILDYSNTTPFFAIRDACLEEVPGWRDIFRGGSLYKPGAPYFLLDLGLVSNQDPSRNHILQLSDTGLSRRIMSISSNRRQIQVQEKNLGRGDLYDFILMATFPARRFFYLAEEIPKYSENLPREAVAEFPSGELYLGGPKDISQIDWQKLQDAVSSKFYALYALAVKQTPDKHITPEKKRELLEIIGSLTTI